MALVRRPAFHDHAIAGQKNAGQNKKDKMRDFRRGPSRAGELKMIATMEPTQSARTGKSATAAASLEGICKNYGEVRALRNVNFAVRAGEGVALLGPNGAGKAAAGKLLIGLMRANRCKGRVRVWGPADPE